MALPKKNDRLGGASIKTTWRGLLLVVVRLVAAVALVLWSGSGLLHHASYLSDSGTRRNDINSATFFTTITTSFLQSGFKSIVIEENDPRYPFLSSIQQASQTSDTTSPTHASSYNASYVERYMLDHAAELGFDDIVKSTCRIWNDPTYIPDVYTALQQYLRQLDDYNRRLVDHAIVPDIRRQWLHNTTLSRHDVCRQLDLHPDGLSGIFSSGNVLSHVTSSGSVEPLLPPLRHPHFCTNNPQIVARKTFRNTTTIDETSYNGQFLLHTDYLVHDLAAVCRNPTYTTTSRNILIDMGASMEFHAAATIKADKNPALYLLELYRKFGLPFDHVYAYEATPVDATTVYDKVPPHHLPAYHWINVPVSTDVHDSKRNPLTMLLHGDFTEADLIVVKIDIDNTPMELSLIQQILNDKRYHKLIDHLYFEDHVRMNELGFTYNMKRDSTIIASLQRFAQLRETGIAAHYWP